MTMAQPDLDSFFSPRSIAVVGASATPAKIGARPLAYLIQKGYKGQVYPINPTRDEIQGCAAFPSLEAVRQPIDLAIFAVPAAKVETALDEAVAAGVRNIVLFSAGFAEIDAEGEQTQRCIVAKARSAGIRMLGPNCLGFMNIRNSVYATFSPVVATEAVSAGSVGIVSQSGAFGAYAYALASQRGVGVSTWVTTGNESDIQVAECIAWMARDPATKVIMAYMEGCKDGALLKSALSLAREAGKPVVVVKVGRTKLGAAAAASHTASLAGDDAAFEALFRQYGAWRARSVDEFFDVAHCLSISGIPSNPKVGLLTVSGGVGVLMADDAAEFGLDVSPLPRAAQDRIRARVPFAATLNPVDVTGQVVSDVELLELAAGEMLREGGYGSLVIFLAAAGLTAPMQAMQKQLARGLREQFPGRVVMFSTLIDTDHQRVLENLGCATFSDPSRAIRVLAALEFYRTQREKSAAETPAARNTVSLRPVFYNEADAMELLQAHGIPVVRRRRARSRSEAAAVARELGFPVVLKVLSPDITHKSDVGGVMLDLADEDAVAAAYDRLLAGVTTEVPDARIDGAMLAPMVRGVVECILGVHRDPVLGHIVMLGAGGTNVELLRDVAFRVVPLGLDEAQSMIGELKIAPLLHGFRGGPMADTKALEDAIVNLSKFAVAAGDTLESIDLNPFVVLPRGQGAAALDAVVLGRRTD